jgi:hypothetical protein
VDEHATGRLAPTTRHTGELDDPSHASLQATRSCVRSWKTNWPRTGHLPRSLVGWPEPIPMMRKLRVSHETIYRSLFVQSRGVLRRELTRHLRTGRSVRRSKAHRGLVGDGRGQLTGIVHICDGPPKPTTGQCLATGKLTWGWARPCRESRRWSSAALGSCC